MNYPDPESGTGLQTMNGQRYKLENIYVSTLFLLHTLLFCVKKNLVPELQKKLNLREQSSKN